MTSSRSESVERRYLRKIESDEKVSDALKHFCLAKQATDDQSRWTNIYDCVDALGPRIGRSQLSKRGLNKIKQRGNEFRHIESRNKSDEELRDLQVIADQDLQTLERIIRELLDSDAQ